MFIYTRKHTIYMVAWIAAYIANHKQTILWTSTSMTLSESVNILQADLIFPCIDPRCILFHEKMRLPHLMIFKALIKDWIWAQVFETTTNWWSAQWTGRYLLLDYFFISSIFSWRWKGLFPRPLNIPSCY